MKILKTFFFFIIFTHPLGVKMMKRGFDEERSLRVIFYSYRKVMVKDATSKKLQVDFGYVEHGHGQVHDRLRNWGRWASVTVQAQVHPMWRYFKAPPQWEPKEYREQCDLLDAAVVEKLVRQLPYKHRLAVRWSYVWRFAPAVAIREFGLSYDGLYRHLRDGRQMLINLSGR